MKELPIDYEARFLELIANDIADRPDRLVYPSERDRDEILELVGDVDVDVDTLEASDIDTTDRLS